MSVQIYVRPKPGRVARHETTHQLLPETGDWWSYNIYSNRLLKAGDIEQCEPPLPEKTPVGAGAEADPALESASDVGKSNRKRTTAK